MNQIPTNLEMSCTTSWVLLDQARLHGIPETEEYLRTPGTYYSWQSFCQISENIGHRLSGDE